MSNIKEPLSNNNSNEDTQADSRLNASQFNEQLDEFKELFNRVSILSQEVGRWSESTLQLFFLEVQRNMAAAKQFFFCQVLFIPLLVLFVFSLCICAGGVGYYFSHDLLVGMSMFLITISLTLVGLAYWQKRLLKHLGFKDTIAQLEEGVDVIYKASQSKD